MEESTRFSSRHTPLWKQTELEFLARAVLTTKQHRQLKILPPRKPWRWGWRHETRYAWEAHWLREQWEEQNARNRDSIPTNAATYRQPSSWEVFQPGLWGWLTPSMVGAKDSRPRWKWISALALPPTEKPWPFLNLRKPSLPFCEMSSWWYLPNRIAVKVQSHDA